MDTKRLVLGFALALLVMLGWSWFMQAYLYKWYPEWDPENRVATVEPAPVEPTTQPTTQIAATQPSEMQVEAPVAPVARAPATGEGGYSVAGAAGEPAVIGLGTDAELFPLQLSLTTTEAAIAGAVLHEFDAQDRAHDYIFQLPYSGEQVRRSLATTAVTINGETIDLTGANWTPQDIDVSEEGARLAFTLDIVRNGQPVAQLVKTYILRSALTASEGYETIVSHTIVNRSDAPLTARITYHGPTVPPTESERGAERQVLAGYADGRRIIVESYYVESFVDEERTRSLLVNEDQLNLAWVGASSIYFNAIARPIPRGEADFVTQDLSEVQAEGLLPSGGVGQQVLLTLRTSDLTVPPGGQVSLDTELFLGPRQRSLLNLAYYELFPRMYDLTLVIASGICGICTWPWLINLLVSLLAAFHFVLRDWGLAIIGLVVLVRLILHPITKRSQLSMMKMAKMGPEIERLRKKYGDNKEELNRAMMEVYKEQGMTPILGCLPMFLQMPIWIALWQALQTTFELRQAPFLYFFGIHLTWIDDLSRPDHLIEFGRSIPLLFGWSISGLNILPLLLAVVMYVQQKLQPKPPATTPEQEQQQKMMQYMVLLFPIFLYNGPAGLNLYIMTSTIWGIIESKIIRKHAQQLEEKEKAERVVVETRPTRGSRRKDEHKAEEPKKKKGLAGWLAQLQERAEEIRRKADEQRGR